MTANLSDRWASLGIAFNEVIPVKNEDPERTLIDSLGEFASDRKLLVLILAWLSNYSDLIHMERLKSLAKGIDDSLSPWLGGLAQSCVAQDRRWTQIINICASKPQITYIPPEFEELQIERFGHDTHFDKFGIQILKFDPNASTKKLRARDTVLNQHTWLRLRALFGANWRADIAWEMIRDKDQTPYQVAKRLGCNNETAYRNWKYLIEGKFLELFKAA